MAECFAFHPRFDLRKVSNSSLFVGRELVNDFTDAVTWNGLPMHTHLALIAVALVAFCFGQPTWASPITYAFSGTTNVPVNGSDLFSGSFTIDGNPDQGPFESDQDGDDVSITLNIGGQTFNYVNNAGFTSSATFREIHLPPWFSEGPGMDMMQLLGMMNTPSGGSLNEFALTVYRPTASDAFSNLRGLSTSLIGNDLQFMTFYPANSSFGGSGEITSAELVSNPAPIPEPTTLAIFTVLGGAAIGSQCRRSRDASIVEQDRSRN